MHYTNTVNIEIVKYCCILCIVCVFFSQARESASLRETLKSEQEAHSCELEQLRSSLLKLQIQLQEKANTAPSLTDKQEEDRRRAEEKAAQEILQLTQVSHVSHIIYG